MKEKEISLKGYWKLPLIAGLVIILSIASTLISVLHKVSHEWIGAPPRRVRIIENEYGFPYTWYWEVRDGGLGGEFARYELELFIVDTIIYLITYSIIAIFIYWLYRLRARLISFKKGKLLFFGFSSSILSICQIRYNPKKKGRNARGSQAKDERARAVYVCQSHQMI